MQFLLLADRRSEHLKVESALSAQPQTEPKQSRPIWQLADAGFCVFPYPPSHWDPVDDLLCLAAVYPTVHALPYLGTLAHALSQLFPYSRIRKSRFLSVLCM